MGQGPSPAEGWDAATLLRRVRKINSADISRPQGWRSGSSVGLFPYGGVTSASGLTPGHCEGLPLGLSCIPTALSIHLF